MGSRIEPVVFVCHLSNMKLFVISIECISIVLHQGYNLKGLYRPYIYAIYL